MIEKSSPYSSEANRRVFGLAGWLCAFLAASNAVAGNFTLNVVDQQGIPVSGFRWLLQEDTTFAVEPGVPTADMLSVSFHKSYHPPARRDSGAQAGTGLSGNTDGSSVPITDVPGSAGNPQRYYVSVLPYAGYSISGAPVVVDGSNPTITVTVQKHPIPTAQISIFLFHDNFPINGAPDLPEETNPAPGDLGHVDWTQFNILVEEPAGRFGIAGGQVIQDAFGNPLGTTYQKGCDADGQPDTDPLTNFGCLDASGDPTVITLGDGTLHPDENGFLTIENLAPGKYGIVAIPPTASGWQQSSTIEGTKVIDAWVKANEPPFFVEFGPPGPHVFIGFLKSSADGGFPLLPAPQAGEQTATVSGLITDMHMSRPPNFQFFSGRPFPDCWVGLNDNTVGPGKGLYAAPCNADSSFSIPDVPPGNYQLKVFDANLDVVIATLGFTVDPTGGTCNAGQSCAFDDVPVFNWFARLNTAVFSDVDQDGFWDPNEIGIGPESQGVTLRWRDGTVYQSFPTDNEGFAPFDEAFPFFHWLVAEVSFVNKKATGATFVVDAGGPVDTTTDAFPGFGELTPQPQCMDDGSGTGATVGYDPATGTCPAGSEDGNPNTGDNLSRTETGPVLTTGFQGFLGQTSVLQFGKTDYVSFDFSAFPPTFVGENGGISGIVFYATTRAEDEPQFAAAEEWEPGIPRVQVALYADGDIDTFPLGDFPNGVGDIDWNGDGVLDGDDNQPDDINQSGQLELADVDNHPLGNFPAPEDVDRNNNGAFDLGDALQITWTDSWDDNLPTGCQGETFLAFGDPAFPTDCYDGLRNFNQVRPAVFDGGYAFDAYALDQLPPAIVTKLNAFYTQPAVAAVGFEGLLPADYIVETATPPGYELLKEEHKNVDFGDDFIPSPQALAATCVGDLRTVPLFLSMVTKDGSGLRFQLIDPSNATNPDAQAPFALQQRPLCDRKKVPLSGGQNAAADFFMMTHVPVVANVSGVMLNDLANEFDPNSPAFGEKFAPPWAPVAFYDWNGKLVSRIHADQFGRYNAVLPSTYTANLPQPSGMSPNMLISCMNDAGPIPNPDPNGPALIIDPFFDPQFSQFCYTFQYMPGAITYLDTPVVPIAAFAGPGQFPVDCERPTLTPMIASVNRRNVSGGGGPFVLPGQQIRIRSMGQVEVPNPEWDGTDLTTKTITRNYNFGGATGLAELGAADGTRIPLTVTNWGGTRIFATVPTTVLPGDYQVVVTRVGGVPAPVESSIGVTLTVGVDVGGVAKGVRPDDGTYDVWSVPGNFATIQEAIDVAAAGDLILVESGVYDELVIMWKPVKLQGWGAGAVTINARQVPTEKILAWRDKVEALVTAGEIDPLPGQEIAPFGFPALAEAVFSTEEGAGIFVAGKQFGANRFGRLANRNARIDGFTIVGASTGGGIVVNAYAQDLVIGNNRLTANAGFFGGGIRVGHPQLSHEILSDADPDFDPDDPNAQVGDIVYDDATNDRIRIHHNHIVKNGGFGGAGGGVSLHTGADAYRVQNNWICGNFSQGDGAGIGHLGLSRGSLIEDNFVIFNESFNQGLSKSGGGIFIGGQVGLMPDAGTGLVLTPGTGNVTIDANLIRSNLAGAGDGGGIRIANVNGLDVAANLDTRAPWYAVNVFNTMINNNAAALAGGGISIQDALKVSIRNNTVANNDSTATAALAFAPGSPNLSTAHPAGIVSRVHSPELRELMTLDVNPDALPPARALQWTIFSDPTLRDDIVYHNRSFFWSNFDDPTTAVVENGLLPATCNTPAAPTGNPLCDVALVAVDDYSDDLAVLDGRVVTADLQNPRFSLLLDGTPYHASNTFITGDPGFVNGYFNVGRDQTLLFPEFTVLQTAGAFDEGGNFIQVAYGPLSLLEPGAAANPANNTTLFDYHLTAASAAINNAANVPAAGRLGVDFDNDPRPNGDLNDIGADEAM